MQMSTLDALFVRITTQEMMLLAQKYNAQYIEVSLLTGENTEELKKIVLLTSLRETDKKGSCNMYLRNMRETLKQQKRALFYSLAMEKETGQYLRRGILDQTLPRIIPEEFIEILERHQGNVATKKCHFQDEKFQQQEQQQQQEKEQITLNEQSGQVSEQQRQLLQEQRGCDWLSGKQSLVKSLELSTMQFIRFGPQHIETLLR